MKMVLGFALLFAGAAGIWLVLSGKFPPSGASSSNPTGITGGGASGDFGAASTGKQPAGTSTFSAIGSGGQSLQSLFASHAFLQPVSQASDLYIR